MKKLLVLFLFGGCLFAQENVNGNRNFYGKVIASQAPETATARVVQTLPTTCDSSNKERVILATGTEYICTATNTWTNVVMGNIINTANGIAPLGNDLTVPVLNLPNLNKMPGSLNIGQLNTTGSASSSTYLRGDGVWSVINSSGGTSGPTNTDGITYTEGGTGSTLRTLTSKIQEVVSVQDFGAIPDAIMRNDANVSVNTYGLSSGSSNFTSADVGKYIEIMGAGPNGTTLESKIVSVQSPSQITLANQASTSLNGNGTFVYGTNNSASFQAALDAIGATGGGTVNIPNTSSCPSKTTCGYIVAATDMSTSAHPSGMKIRFDNITIKGSNTNLFCRGAWNTYSSSAEFPGQTAAIRGNCINIGDNAGPQGASGTTVKNVTISGLHLYGMTSGNTGSVATNATAAPLLTTGDGWDTTNRAIYMWDNSAFDNVLIEGNTIQDFKGEGVYSGGSATTNVVIQNNKITNFNGDAISMLSADLKVLNNKFTNGSNAAVETFTEGNSSGAGFKLVRQVFKGNTISGFPAEAISIGGSDASTTYAGTIEILDNYIDNIGVINGGSGSKVAINLYAQTSSNAPDNILVRGNVFHNCYNTVSKVAGELTAIFNNQTIGDTSSPKSFTTDFSTPPMPLTETVTFSATPTFSSTIPASIITLTGNISFTLNPGIDGQTKTLTFCQNATGGYTATAPANVRGFFTISTTPSKCSTQTFTYYNSQSAWFSNGLGVVNQ